MERFREKFNECLREQVCSYRREKGQSKEWMAARLHVDPRSYSDQEKGEYGFSALSFLFFLMSPIKTAQNLSFFKILKHSFENNFI